MTTAVEPGSGFAPQDLVLTLLAAHLPRRDRWSWSGGLVSLLGEFGFSAGAARIALARMVHRGLLDRGRNGRYVNYALSEHARDLLAEGDRRIFSFGRNTEPVATWTVVWQAVPEDRRQAREWLVRRLRFAGFGSLQDGTWIAPHDREQAALALLDELGVTRYAGLLLGTPSLARGLIDRIWDLDALAKRYRAFVEAFAAAPAATDRDAWQLRTRLVHTFRQFAVLDPELPEDLVAAPEGRAAAIDLFHHRYPALAPAAQRYFDEVTTT
jgi:phenylacetic acid degradation operon negative regulatory protein